MTTLKKTMLIMFLLTLEQFAYSQPEFSKWFFGNYAGLDFSTSPPTVLTTGSLSTNEGCATISNNTGNLLFYTDGVVVRNSSHAIMANGSGLNGHYSTTQSALIVKQPGNSNIYYIFTLDQTGQSNGACYSIVDMNLAAGMGSVTVKNATLYTPSCEKQVAVRHCNGKDVWIISHENNTKNFRAYLLTNTGLNPTPVISGIGETPSGYGPQIGHIKVSPDGKKLAVATFSASSPGSLGQGGFHLFDFDAATGVISNSLIVKSVIGAYSVEFSPDGSKLYGALSETGIIFQWDLCASTASAIAASQYSISTGITYPNGIGSFQRAIDGKIYMAADGLQNLSVINNPNASGAAMGFSLNTLSVAPATCRLGLPNYINPYTKPNPAPFTSSISCQSVSFSVPATPTLSSGCSSFVNPPLGYKWEFGDPASGTANTSTLTNPTHVFSSTGVYTPTLVIYNACYNDTLKQNINITAAAPSPSVAGTTFTVCKGDRYTYTVSGGSTYSWSTGGSATTVALSPTITTVYSFTATKSGCSATKSFTINVSPCLGLTSVDTGKDSGIRFYPNPVKETLIIEASQTGSFGLFDLAGKQVLETSLNVGQNKLHTTSLSKGVYFIRAVTADGIFNARLMKSE